MAFMRLTMKYLRSSPDAGAQLGGDTLGAPPPATFHNLAKRRNTFYTRTEAMYYLIIFLRPPLEVTQLRPCPDDRCKPEIKSKYHYHHHNRYKEEPFVQ